jgi:N-acetylglucosamine kinase
LFFDNLFFRWGHLLGDEGSGYWIAQRGIKRIFDHEDNLIVSHYDLTRLKNGIKTYFKVNISFLLIFFLILSIQ